MLLFSFYNNKLLYLIELKNKNLICMKRQQIKEISIELDNYFK